MNAHEFESTIKAICNCRNLDFLDIRAYEVIKANRVIVSTVRDKLYRTQRCISMNIDGQTIIYSRCSFTLDLIPYGGQKNTYYLKGNEVVLRGSLGENEGILRSLSKAYNIVFQDEKLIDKEQLKELLADTDVKLTKYVNNLHEQYKKYKESFIQSCDTLSQYTDEVNFERKMKIVSWLSIIGLKGMAVYNIYEYELGKIIEGANITEQEKSALRSDICNIYNHAAVVFKEQGEYKVLSWIKSQDKIIFMISTHKVDADNQLYEVEHTEVYSKETLPEKYILLGMYATIELSEDSCLEYWGLGGESLNIFTIAMNLLGTEGLSISQKYARALEMWLEDGDVSSVEEHRLVEKFIDQ